MAPVIPNPKKIKAFPTESAFETWLRANHDRETEIWLKIHKKETGLRTVTHAQAVDVALCWGWIDGIRKGFDERSFVWQPFLHRPLERPDLEARERAAIERGEIQALGFRWIGLSRTAQ